MMLQVSGGEGKTNTISKQLFSVFDFFLLNGALSIHPLFSLSFHPILVLFLSLVCASGGTLHLVKEYLALSGVSYESPKC